MSCCPHHPSPLPPRSPLAFPRLDPLRRRPPSIPGPPGWPLSCCVHGMCERPLRRSLCLAWRAWALFARIRLVPPVSNTGRRISHQLSIIKYSICKYSIYIYIERESLNTLYTYIHIYIYIYIYLYLFIYLWYAFGGLNFLVHFYLTWYVYTLFMLRATHFN